MPAGIHLVVHALVHLDDQLPVCGGRQLQLLAVTRHRRAGDQTGVDQALHMLGHRALELVGAGGQADHADRAVGEYRQQMQAECG